MPHFFMPLQQEFKNGKLNQFRKVAAKKNAEELCGPTLAVEGNGQTACLVGTVLQTDDIEERLIVELRERGRARAGKLH